jgi:two-component system response regulator DesR
MSCRDSPSELRIAMAAHADGLVEKDSEAEKFTDAVRRVAAGEKVLDPDLAVIWGLRVRLPSW